MKTHVAYLSEINCMNLGDIIINGFLIRELSKHAIIYIYGEPCQEVIEIYEFSNIYKDNIIRIKPPKGGRYIQELYFIYMVLIDKIHLDYYFQSPGHVYGTEIRGMFRFVLRSLQTFIFSIKNIKIVIYGATFGPFDNIRMFFYRSISLITNKFYITVRDSSNYQELKNYKFKNIGLIPDLSYLIDNNYSVNSSSELLSLCNNKYIVVSFRTPFEGAEKDDVYSKAIIDKISQVIAYKKRINSKIILVVSFQVDSDLPFMENVYEIIKNELDLGQVVFMKKRLSLGEAICLYKNAENIYTNRLHVYLLAEISGTKAIVITDIKKHKKIVNYMIDNSGEDLLVNVYIKDANWEKIHNASMQDLSLLRYLHKEKKIAIKTSIKKILETSADNENVYT